MDMINELFQNMLHSSAAGTLGVLAIWVYMAVILGTAFFRIVKGDHMHH